MSAVPDVSVYFYVIIIYLFFLISCLHSAAAFFSSCLLVFKDQPLAAEEERLNAGLVGSVAVRIP